MISSPYFHKIIIMFNDYARKGTIVFVLQCFEGMKAYRGADGKIRLFRPMENMNRMKRSAVAASLPVRGGGGGGRERVSECVRERERGRERENSVHCAHVHVYWLLR